ncbi:hypothetical protein EVAR_69364_1 [Eumeta japonica]|uniref:Uncharacterized protein n=1 Tax=Eumeta variegata TaxID=151549 RepID=A0A4C1SAK6_EUMVA|nr:hypothetical protein EVAR_69364_1 [Eumeta japonica]
MRPKSKSSVGLELESKVWPESEGEAVLRSKFETGAESTMESESPYVKTEVRIESGIAVGGYNYTRERHAAGPEAVPFKHQFLGRGRSGGYSCHPPAQMIMRAIPLFSLSENLLFIAMKRAPGNPLNLQSCAIENTFSIAEDVYDALDLRPGQVAAQHNTAAGAVALIFSWGRLAFARFLTLNIRPEDRGALGGVVQKIDANTRGPNDIRLRPPPARGRPSRRRRRLATNEAN